MKNQMKKLIAFCLMALMAASALYGLAACKKAEEEQPQQPVPLGEAGLEQAELNGQTCYIIPYHLLSVEAHGTCYVNAECDLTDAAAFTAAEALLADAGENETAIVNKRIWASDDHIYLFCTQAMAEAKAAGDDDRVVLALVKSGDGWQTEELLPYPQSLSLFQRIIEETQPLRELTEEELNEAVRLCYNKAAGMKQRGEYAISWSLSAEDIPSDADIASSEPIYSGEAGYIYNSPEKSDRVLAELLMRRTAEKEDYSVADNPLVLFISINGAYIWLVSSNEADWNIWNSTLTVTQPLLPYLIERDPETGRLSGSVLENWTAVGFESGNRD